jgi:hypothetical protein
MIGRSALLLLLIVTAAGCSVFGSDPTSRAIDSATTDARSAANRTLVGLTSAVRSGSLDDALHNVIANQPETPTTVLASSVGTGSSFTADLAIVAVDEAGSGGSYKQLGVRLCLRYSGVLGSSGHVGMADLSCPHALSTTVRGVRIVQDVTLGK